MSFVDPLDEPINPYTGYPFRKESLDERIRRILEDDDDDEIPVATSSVKINAEQIDTVYSNRVVASAKQNSVLPGGKDIRNQYSLIPSIPVKTRYNVNNVSSNRSASSINQNPTIAGDRIANDNYSLAQPKKVDSSSRFTAPVKKTAFKYEKTRWQISPVTPTESMDSRYTAPAKKPSLKYEKTRWQIPPVTPTESMDSRFTAPAKKTAFKYEKTRWPSTSVTPTESMDTFSSNSSVESDKHTSVGKNLKREYKLIPYDAVQTLYKMDAISSTYSSDSVKQIPGNSSVKDKSPIIQPPNKRIKLEYKHSFNFIGENSNIDEKSEKFERSQHESIFQHMDDSMKKEEINQAYQEVTEIVELLWPNPRKVTKDVKVTALNVNEFMKDDVFQMMLDAALNNPNLFKAHELSFTGTQKF
uniref:Uncharacterized protein n=1 Tax=Panagrolaimus davidi TaxID=227884 RepID=A0A914Q2I4_9BILA